MNKLIRKVKYFFFGDVTKILGGFTKLEKKLTKAVEFHNGIAAEARSAYEAAKTAEQAAVAAVTKAETVKRNITALLGE
jgi:hypothetical protein